MISICGILRPNDSMNGTGIKSNAFSQLQASATQLSTHGAWSTTNAKDGLLIGCMMDLVSPLDCMLQAVDFSCPDDAPDDVNALRDLRVARNHMMSRMRGRLWKSRNQTQDDGILDLIEECLKRTARMRLFHFTLQPIFSF
jgi:hypothetical protein